MTLWLHRHEPYTGMTFTTFDWLELLLLALLDSATFTLSTQVISVLSQYYNTILSNDSIQLMPSFLIILLSIIRKSLK